MSLAKQRLVGAVLFILCVVPMSALAMMEESDEDDVMPLLWGSARIAAAGEIAEDPSEQGEPPRGVEIKRTPSRVQGALVGGFFGGGTTFLAFAYFLGHTAWIYIAPATGVVTLVSALLGASCIPRPSLSQSPVATP